MNSFEGVGGVIAGGVLVVVTLPLINLLQYQPPMNVLSSTKCEIVTVESGVQLADPQVPDTLFTFESADPARGCLRLEQASFRTFRDGIDAPLRDAALHSAVGRCPCGQHFRGESGPDDSLTCQACGTKTRTRRIERGCEP